MILKSHTLNVTKLLLLQLLYPGDGAEKGLQRLNTWLPILDHLLNHAPKLLSSEFLDMVMCQLVPSDRLDGWSLRLWYEKIDGSPAYLLVLQNLQQSIRLVLEPDNSSDGLIRPADEMFRKEPPAVQSAKDEATKASELRQRLFSDLSDYITNRDAQEVEEAAKGEGPMHPQKAWSYPAKDRRAEYAPYPTHLYPKIAARGDK